MKLYNLLICRGKEKQQTLLSSRWWYRLYVSKAYSASSLEVLNTSAHQLTSRKCDHLIKNANTHSKYTLISEYCSKGLDPNDPKLHEMCTNDVWRCIPQFTRSILLHSSPVDGCAVLLLTPKSHEIHDLQNPHSQRIIKKSGQINLHWKEHATLKTYLFWKYLLT